MGHSWPWYALAMVGAYQLTAAVLGAVVRCAVRGAAQAGAVCRCRSAARTSAVLVMYHPQPEAAPNGPSGSREIR
ncbi:hypothetical protein [Streptomyces gobiensis]|uniref:hypothetical protein n=1 Tax=Streptomyces gobiensis TaxID=2875706 RepID=UPI001E387034|nr:hypothetical protein [Streptomyces gobiensis]UGY93079.1 hypothetical protein test1122_16095 [Streptomyces gobiensis]